jgi:hypothetical protein
VCGGLISGIRHQQDDLKGVPEEIIVDATYGFVGCAVPKAIAAFLLGTAFNVGLYQSRSQGGHSGLHSIANSQLVHDASDVCLDGIGTQK